MDIIHTVKELKRALQAERKPGRRIGFVPTMGALHGGHISLVQACGKENNVCVVSLFVNPTQFNSRQDLDTYPRTFEEDRRRLEDSGCCDYLFVPSEKEIYPQPDKRTFNLGAVAEVMEGACRPGHFNGVAQVVSRLFSIVEPDNAYFGEKDFQQIAVIRAMVAQLGLPVSIHACPIVREADGLAMSSRNVRLTAAQRAAAPLIAATLQQSAGMAGQKSVADVERFVTDTINAHRLLNVEYFHIVCADTLMPLVDWARPGQAAGCIAVRCGEVRLIDCIRY